MVNLRIGKFGKIGPAKFFVMLAALFGLIFVVITPPFQTPDETFHFYRAYQISTFNFIPDKQQGSQVDGGLLPSSIWQTVSLTSFNPDIRFHNNAKYDWHKTFKAFSIHTDQRKKQFYETSSAIYTPVMYIPQTAAILVGRFINAPPILMMYMARLAVLATYIAFLTLAIKLVPRKKWVVAVIGLVPMSLFQAVALGGDALVIGASSLLLAYILHLRDKNARLAIRQLIILFLVSSLCVLSKGITILFLPLLWLIPDRLFSGGKLSRLHPQVIKTFIAAASVLLFVSWLFLVRGNDIQTVATISGQADTAGQIQFILHHPLNYLNTLWNTYFYFLTSSDLTGSFIGWFGYMDTPMAAWITTIGYIGLTVLLVAKTEPNYDDKVKAWLTRKEKILILSVIALYWLAVNTSMYAACSNVGSDLICGLQGRYFLPILLPLLPVVYYGWLKIKPSAYKRVAVGLPIFLLTASIITIWYRYYVHAL